MVAELRHRDEHIDIEVVRSCLSFTTSLFPNGLYIVSRVSSSQRTWVGVLGVRDTSATPYAGKRKSDEKKMDG